jgi:hypothetical protein
LVKMLAPLAIAALSFACSDDSSDGDDTTGGTSSGGTAGTANAGTGGTSSAGTGGTGGGADAVSFATDVYPLLRMKCGLSGCHDGSTAPFLPAHGAADETVAYEATQDISMTDGMTPVYERIFLRVSGTTDFGFMPPDCGDGPIGAEGCLTQAEVDLIQEWVEQGAPP